jgi:hypothetical protein
MNYYSPNLLALSLAISLIILLVPGIAMGIYWWREERKERSDKAGFSGAEDRRESGIRDAA